MLKNTLSGGINRWNKSRVHGSHRFMSDCSSTPGQRAASSSNAFWFSMGRLGRFTRVPGRRPAKWRPQLPEPAAAWLRVITGESNKDVNVRTGHLPQGPVTREGSKVLLLDFKRPRVAPPPRGQGEGGQVKRWWGDPLEPSRALSASACPQRRHTVVTTTLYSSF